MNKSPDQKTKPRIALAERFPSGPSTRPDPPFSLINSHPFGSARSSPGREAAKRTLDGEDRSGIIQGEGKGDSCPPRDFRGVKRGKERSGEARSSAASDER